MIEITPLVMSPLNQGAATTGTNIPVGRFSWSLATGDGIKRKAKTLGMTPRPCDHYSREPQTLSQRQLFVQLSIETNAQAGSPNGWNQYLKKKTKNYHTKNHHIQRKT